MHVGVDTNAPDQSAFLAHVQIKLERERMITKPFPWHSRCVKCTEHFQAVWGEATWSELVVAVQARLVTRLLLLLLCFLSD